MQMLIRVIGGVVGAAIGAALGAVVGVGLILALDQVARLFGDGTDSGVWILTFIVVPLCGIYGLALGAKKFPQFLNTFWTWDNASSLNADTEDDVSQS